MKLLLDEMFTGYKHHFEILGYTVQTVEDVGLKGSEDMKVAKYAYDNDYILITEDKRKPVDFMKILKGKYILVDASMIVKMIDNAVREKYGE
jgi:predicted nuclease of predicted toxin-antitoxin system